MFVDYYLTVNTHKIKEIHVIYYEQLYSRLLLMLIEPVLSAPPLGLTLLCSDWCAVENGLL